MNKPIINSTFETIEPTKEELEKQFMKMPELETDTHKRININTFMPHENELCFAGTDENGEQITVWFDSAGAGCVVVNTGSVALSSV